MGPNVDLTAIKSYVCNTDWNAVKEELITDLEIAYIESQVSGFSISMHWELALYSAIQLSSKYQGMRAPVKFHLRI